MKLSSIKTAILDKLPDCFGIGERFAFEPVHIPIDPFTIMSNQENPLLDSFRKASATISVKPDTMFSPYTRKYLMICFTPRSGSSWLTDRIDKVDHLGKAGEFLNPAFVPRILERYPAGSLPEYLNRVLKGTSSKSGVSSIELTWFHLRNYAAAIGLKPLQDSLPKPFDNDAYYVWLCRHDFVAQGVSLYKATESGLFHAPQKDSNVCSAEGVIYDREKIKQWCQHVLQQEYGFEKWFEKNTIRPLRIFYEDMVASPDFTLETIFNFVREDVPGAMESITSAYSKLGNSHSEQLIRRFKEDEEEFVNIWAKNRGLMPAV